MARAIGVWWLSACKIVYVINESGPITRFGFAYGTLPDHAGTGEERFLIEWTHADNSVWYDILAFSRPNHFLARLGYRSFFEPRNASAGNQRKPCQGCSVR